MIPNLPLTHLKKNVYYYVSKYLTTIETLFQKHPSILPTNPRIHSFTVLSEHNVFYLTFTYYKISE